MSELLRSIARSHSSSSALVLHARGMTPWLCALALTGAMMSKYSTSERTTAENHRVGPVAAPAVTSPPINTISRATVAGLRTAGGLAEDQPPTPSTGEGSGAPVLKTCKPKTNLLGEPFRVGEKGPTIRLFAEGNEVRLETDGQVFRVHSAGMDGGDVYLMTSVEAIALSSGLSSLTRTEDGGVVGSFTIPFVKTYQRTLTARQLQALTAAMLSPAGGGGKDGQRTISLQKSDGTPDIKITVTPVHATEQIAAAQ